MAVELLDNGLIRLEPGPYDAHMHPRVTDAVSYDAFNELNQGKEGKAGLSLYTRGALRSGITGGNIMPNEQGRLLVPDYTELTNTIPYPIANLDRVRAVEFMIAQQSYMPLGIYMGLDPQTVYLDKKQTIIDRERLEKNFADVQDDCVGLKIYGDETTGGFNIATGDIWQIVEVWHKYNPDKPIILHLEDEKVGQVLNQINELKGIGKDVPIHIAHVSSRQELEGVIEAKARGMNISCEVTPHHLFLDDSVPDEIGNYGCMKPTLKKQEDIDFLWANIDKIDMIASDCAPHRTADKESGKVVYGITNHSVMLPLLIGAVHDGKLTWDQLYDKLCIQPRKRFGIPMDNSFTTISTAPLPRRAEDYEWHVDPNFGHNAFARLNRKFHLVGRVVEVGAGASYWRPIRTNPDLELKTSYTHVLRPATFALQQEIQAAYWQHPRRVTSVDRLLQLP